MACPSCPNFELDKSNFHALCASMDKNQHLPTPVMDSQKWGDPHPVALKYGFLPSGLVGAWKFGFTLMYSQLSAKQEPI